MKPIKFKGMNVTYAENQEPYLPLPAFKHNDDWGCVTSCWGLSILERFKVLVTGKVWLTMPTFGKPLTPAKIEVSNPTDKQEEK